MIEIRELNNTSFTDVQYKEFLHEFNKERTEYKYKQYEWYKKWQKYKVAVAIIDGHLVGQSTAYTCSAYCSGNILPLSWGCDAFVLPQYRGLGLGKKLQKYLHEHTENFSSAGYTALNGIIKRKCGAKEILQNDFVYYPFSNLLNFIIRKGTKKIFKKELNIHLCKTPFYYFINYKKIEGFEMQIEKYETILEEVLPFIDHVLKSQYDFFVIRDRNYMRWKYVENPTMTYKLMTVRKSKKLIAVIFFTDISSCLLSGINLVYCKLLDSIIIKDCGFTQKDALLSIMKYWKSQKVHLDGIVSMFNVHYIGKLGFKRPMLSTLANLKISSHYMAYSDQDLEQMH